MKKNQIFFDLIYPAIIVPLCIVAIITEFRELTVLANGILIGQIIRCVESIWKYRSKNDL